MFWTWSVRFGGSWRNLVEARFLNEVAFPKGAEAHLVNSAIPGKPRVLPEASPRSLSRRRDSELTLRSTLSATSCFFAPVYLSAISSAMSAATSASRQQLRKIAARWPADPFRPNVQLKTLLTSLAEHPYLTSSAVRATQALQRDEFKHKVCIPNVPYTGLVSTMGRHLPLDLPRATCLSDAALASGKRSDRKRFRA